MNIGYPISETSRLSFGLSAQQDTIDSGRYTVDEIFDFIEEEGDSYLNFKASVGWSESTLNRGVLATRGHSQSLSLETTIPGSDLSFYKLDYNAQLFVPVTKTYTMRLHTQLGYGDAYGSTSRLPFYEHYYAGGIGSVRGFRDSSLGPLSTPATIDPDKDQLPFGGNVKVTGGAELIFPAPFVTDQRSLRTVLFVDVGNVFDTECSNTTLLNGRENPGCGSVDAGQLRYSAGIGLSWLTALGPLGFSLAMPLNDESEDDTQVFQFTLGQTF